MVNTPQYETHSLGVGELFSKVVHFIRVNDCCSSHVSAYEELFSSIICMRVVLMIQVSVSAVCL